jgi:lipopolysaccharide/colanic/teichoic acid biosynthesis glycosyltransferase
MTCLDLVLPVVEDRAWWTMTKTQKLVHDQEGRFLRRKKLMPTRAVLLTKRILDVTLSSIGLGITLPFYPLIAGAIRYDSPGPIFHKQRRAGELLPHSPGQPTGKVACTEFTMYKFRSMRTDAEKFTGAVIASENDPRVTRVGRFLRKSRIDELPQLWNVLRGDMSIVGPRPERPEILSTLAMAIP